MGEMECQTQQSQINEKGSRMHLILCNTSQNWHLLMLKILKQFFSSHLFCAVPLLTLVFSLSHKPSVRLACFQLRLLTCMQERADLEDKIELDLSKLFSFLMILLIIYLGARKQFIGSTFLTGLQESGEEFSSLNGSFQWRF